MKRIWKRCVAVCIAFSLLTGIFPMADRGPIEVQAAGAVLTLGMVKQSAVANSPAYEKLESQLELKEVSLKQAVKSIREKKRNMSTFRWTPLLSFKFPEKPNLSEEYEFQFKPMQIQSEIDEVKHKMTDQVLEIYENVSNLYVDIVVLGDTIDFNEERLRVVEETLEKSRHKLKLGQATESDIMAMEKSVEALKVELAADQRSLEAQKKKLSEAVGMDVTTGYTFRNPFVNADIKRSQLEALTQYTLDRDETYYEASMAASLGKLSVETNYDLMSGQYGGKMGTISSYVKQALAGQKVDNKAFRKAYDQFLKEIDKPWQGSWRILFIKIPKEWLKGQISGIRYVEDEPYALHEAVLEYQDALLEQENTRKSVTTQVEDSFNALVSMRNAYTVLTDQVQDARNQLTKDEVLNRLGELTYDEYKTSLDDYEDLQNEMFEALASYSQSLYSFDRLTCGGVTALLEGTEADLNTGAGGESYVEEEYAEGAYYYVESIIQGQEFRLGVSIPDDLDVEVTDFELWCDDVQVGSRTAIDKTIRHLALSVDGGTAQVKIRFYNGNEFVDDCEIDPNAVSGPLSIVKSYTVVQAEDREIGTYTSRQNAVTGMVTLSLKPRASEKIGYYLIRNGSGEYLMTAVQIPIEKEFSYLSLLKSDLGELVIEFYGEDSSLKYTGYFDTVNERLMKNPEET